MEVRFANAEFGRLENDTGFNAGFGIDLVRAYRKRMQLIRAANNECDFYAFKSLRFEKLKGDRSHQHSLRLNDQWRLIIEIIKENPKNVILIKGIEDYH